MAKNEASPILSNALTSKNITKEAQNLCSNCNWQTPGQDYCQSINLSWMSNMHEDVFDVYRTMFLKITEWCCWNLFTRFNVPEGHNGHDAAKTRVLKFSERTVLMRNLYIVVATHWKAAFFFAKSWQALWPRVALYCDVSLMSGGMSRSTDLEINDIFTIFLEISHLSRVKRKSDHSSSPHLT